ncbi:unnamed protein product [Timema podura]|uniref:Uncharacterized protein n=1 Tax=Timema podura TaxID=61482 RepID=A0ABN7NNH3_TIMPD|nr:unnamed protein product [Timema podura]
MTAISYAVAVFLRVESNYAVSVQLLQAKLGEGSSILPPGGHHLDHDRLFRSSQNIVAPYALRNKKDNSGDKLQVQLKKRLESNRSQVWSRQNLDEMHLSYMRSQQ